MKLIALQPEQKQAIEEFEARLLNVGFSLMDGEIDKWTLFRTGTEDDNELDIILRIGEITINGGTSNIDTFLLNCPHFSQGAREILNDALEPEEHFSEIEGAMYICRGFYYLQIFEADEIS